MKRISGRMKGASEERLRFAKKNCDSVEGGGLLRGKGEGGRREEEG